RALLPRHEGVNAQAKNFAITWRGRDHSHHCHSLTPNPLHECRRNELRLTSRSRVVTVGTWPVTRQPESIDSRVSQGKNGRYEISCRKIRWGTAPERGSTPCTK